MTRAEQQAIERIAGEAVIRETGPINTEIDKLWKALRQMEERLLDKIHAKERAQE